MEFVTDKPYNRDRNCFGFTIRTRRRYYDESIINQCLDETKDVYRVPHNIKIAIDVGANIGCVSLVAARRGAEKIYAFEPEQNNYETLCFNVIANHYEKQIECIQLGVGKPGEAKLYVHNRNSGATSTYLDQNGLDENHYQMVKLISIRDVFKNYNIDYCDFLKLDCEGSEKDIINDLDTELADKIGQISVEFHDKKIMGELINKLLQWYKPIHATRYERVFVRCMGDCASCKTPCNDKSRK